VPSLGGSVPSPRTPSLIMSARERFSTAMTELDRVLRPVQTELHTLYFCSPASRPHPQHITNTTTAAAAAAATTTITTHSVRTPPPVQSGLHTLDARLPHPTLPSRSPSLSPHPPSVFGRYKQVDDLEGAHSLAAGNHRRPTEATKALIAREEAKQYTRPTHLPHPPTP
jgi:hypothetical protein